MKNKKNIYILLPIVLLVWGAVLYQLFSFSNAETAKNSENPEFTIKPLVIKERDSFTINVNYRDPFLGKIYTTKIVSKNKTNASKRKSDQKETLIWPNIIYKGIVSDTKDKNKIFILIIDGHNYFMKIGDTQNEIFLKSGDKESVYVKYKGNLNLILLQD